MSKVFVDQIPPESGRKYSIKANGDGSSSIADITVYAQDGTPWSALDANQTMRKEEYDADGDGVVDKAKALAATLPIAKGGTGATTAAAARNALGLGNTAGALPIANGGTGATTAAAARNALGLGNTAGALPVASGGTGQTTLALARNAMGLGNTTGALPFANGGIGVAKTALALTSLVRTTNESGVFTITGLSGVICAVANIGNDIATNTRHAISFMEPVAGTLSGIVFEGSTGNVLPNYTFRAHIVYFSL